MIQLLGTSITDKIYNTAISRQYTPEAAAAIAATISLEVSGTTLIPYRGDRYRKYADYCERKDSNPQLPDTQIAFIFDNLSDYNTSKVKYAKTIDDAVRAFNEEYLKKALNTTEFLTLTILANEINRLFVEEA
jgi:hypothetical protein